MPLYIRDWIGRLERMRLERTRLNYWVDAYDTCNEPNLRF